MCSLIDICNGNLVNMPSDEVYSAFNSFIFSNDIKVLGKMLHRFNFLNDIMHIPGDIVEVGVFKGSGVATFSKFIEIFCPNSNKKVVGFDIFSPSDANSILDKGASIDKDTMNVVYSKVSENELSIESVENRLQNMNIHKKHILVKGDVEKSIPEYLQQNPGFRISMLYIDVDIEAPTYHALNGLWDRILPGGVIVFDEYEYHKFSESSGVEKFLKERGIPYDLHSTNFMAPTAYFVKKHF